MPSDNPNHISDVLHAQLDSPLDRATFEIAQIVFKQQGSMIESVTSSPSDEIEARMEAFNNDAPHTRLHGSKAAWLLGIVGAVIDHRADQSDQEFTEAELSRMSHGGSL